MAIIAVAFAARCPATWPMPAPHATATLAQPTPQATRACLVTMGVWRGRSTILCPLCAQPAFPATVLDTAGNMAWEAADEAEVKDRFERRLCRALGRGARLQLGPEVYRDAFVTYAGSSQGAAGRATAEFDPAPTS